MLSIKGSPPVSILVIQGSQSFVCQERTDEQRLEISMLVEILKLILRLLLPSSTDLCIDGLDKPGGTPIGFRPSLPPATELKPFLTVGSRSAS